MGREGMKRRIPRETQHLGAAGCPGTHFKQGYLNSQKERVVRVRIEGTRAKLTMKGLTTGVSRGVRVPRSPWTMQPSCSSQL